MFPVAYIPPLWYAIMNPRLVAAVGGDASRINFAPGQRSRLVAQYGLTEPSTAPHVPSTKATSYA